MAASFALGENYIHLAPDGAASQVPVGPDFWQRIDERRELHEGRLLTFFHLGPGNVHWERHPAGDEILILVSGKTAILLEEGGKQRRLWLKAGEAFIVPRGLWHAFDVSEPADLLAITPGEGTEMRAD